jgi:hypothetical protein
MKDVSPVWLSDMDSRARISPYILSCPGRSKQSPATGPWDFEGGSWPSQYRGVLLEFDLVVFLIPRSSEWDLVWR